MRLVIFDSDGTLTDTAQVDAECFQRALAEAFGFAVDIDWSHYPHASDAGIFQEVFQRRMGRPPDGRDIERMRRRFVNLLATAARNCRIESVAGAPQLLCALHDNRRFRIAFATGCWNDSARLKMAGARMNYDAYPSASADDAPERESIMQLVMERAAVRYGGLEDSVYVGDGVWDARACRALGIPFIGIG